MKLVLRHLSNLIDFAKLFAKRRYSGLRVRTYLKHIYQ